MGILNVKGTTVGDTLHGLHTDKFSIETQSYNDTFKFNIKGTIDISLPHQVLDPYFTEMHNVVLSFNYKLIYIDVKELYFVNSGALRSLLGWITNIGNLPREKRYKINFLLDIKTDWQKHSFYTIFNLYEEIVEFSF
jgi:hypothetical protein